MFLFRKKQSPVAKKARENSQACAKAIEIIQKCSEVGDKEISHLAKILKRVNPEINEAWFRKIVNMAKMGYLAYASRMRRSGQTPTNINKFVKDTLEGQINQVRQVWERLGKEI